MNNSLVQRLDRVDPNAYLSIKGLLSLLYPKNPPLAFETFQEVIQKKGVEVYIALVGGAIVGMASLASYKKLSGLVFEIEDVVVETSCQRRGVGRRMVDVLMERARDLGADFIDVSTRDAPASLFYQRCGFVEQGHDRPFFYLRRYLNV